MSIPVLSNLTARRLFLSRHMLTDAPTGTDHLATIRALGFVQIDSVNTLARAHDMILWSRRNRYRPAALDRLLARDRAVFEHWTHDAAVLPIETFPHWRRRFAQFAARMARGARDHADEITQVRAHVADHGACTTRDVGPGEARGNGGWWDWHPSKTALEYLWRTGEVSVVRRTGFRKVYDLTERVIPSRHRDARPTDAETIHWACGAALDRLGFATSGELAAFWAIVTPAEARDWCAAALARGEVEEIAVENHDGTTRRHVARPGLPRDLPAPAPRVRVLSPFDPALRDRKRAERLFGFHYRIEIFVPEAQRKYGYYVFPVLEGDRMIGRVDMRADRASSTLRVTAFWPEPGVRMGEGRRDRFGADLGRIARLAACDRIVHAPGWLQP